MSDILQGTLFLVATPIGNLEDITLRALRVLREVQIVAAEDTRHTSKLLHHFGIQARMLSVHDHNESTRLESVLLALGRGDSVALVSDAGTPAISDPGFKLVRAALAAGFRVESIPGPSAVMTALTASGLPTDTFVFVGFVPSKASARQSFFRSLRNETRTLVFFEAPHRIRESLAEAFAVLGDREVAVARELTKLHEEWARGPLSSVAANLSEPRGEFTVVLAGCPEVSAVVDPSQPTDTAILSAYEEEAALYENRREAIAALAHRLGLPSRTVYDAIVRAKHS